MSRVLIVDDDDDFREAMAAALTRVGFRIEHATDGAAALQVIRQGRWVPCAMLIDLMMPNMDGWELIDAVRKDPALAHIPSAVVSAARDTRRLPESTVTFSKPCNLGEVIRFLQAANCPQAPPQPRA
jgi:CheY-like chemotaxis protein